MSRASSRATTIALVAVIAGAVVACADDPVHPSPRIPGARVPDAPLPSVPGASSLVRVEVPASMRHGIFSVDRFLAVPPHFRIAVYARVNGARFMAIAPNGDLLVSVPNEGRIVLVRSAAAGADPAITNWATGLYRPHDIVFHTIGSETYVYVAEADKVARYRYAGGDQTGQGRQVVIGGLPSGGTPGLAGYGHELKNIALDSDHRLYVSIASACNVCFTDRESDPVRGAVYVYGADGSSGRLLARGIRNAEGLAFVPGTNDLWVAVNNRDNIRYPHHADITGDGVDDYGAVIPAYVDDHPPEAFTRVRDGGDYGWPFCNSTAESPSGFDDMPLERDVELNADGSRLDCSVADRTSKGIQAHSAPLGLTFLQRTGVPAPYDAGAAIALHGSWNRQRNTGYKVIFFPWDAAAGRPGAQVDLVTGWATDFDAWGRPVDVAVDRTGSILVSDDYGGAIYRLTYAPPGVAAASLADDHSGKCLDVVGAGRAAGTPLIIYPCHGGANQQFSPPPLGGTGEVRVYDTMCLEAANDAGGNGTPVVIASCQGLPRQEWTRTAAGELRALDGRCLDVLGARTDDLTTVWLWDCLGAANQRWTAGVSGSTNVRLASRASGKCLDVLGAARAPGTPLVIYPCHDGDNQRFTLPSVGATGEVRAYGGTMCLDADGARGADGDRIVVWSCHGGSSQQWTRTPSGELRGINGKCIDVLGARTEDLTTVWLWSCLSADNQRWEARS